MQECLDIVASQGAHLITRSGMPVFQGACCNELAAALDGRLETLFIEYACRRAMYHGTTNEWLLRHIPLELEEQYRAEQEALLVLEGNTSESGSDDDGP